MYHFKLLASQIRPVHAASMIRRHSSLITSLSERGLLKTVTSPNLDVITAARPVSLYCGVDPTAPSLHVGNLLTLIPVLHFYIRGHNAFALVGGATGQVGDPAGKNDEREKLAAEALSTNVSALSRQLTRFFKHGAEYAAMHGYDSGKMGQMKVVNNADWYSNLNFMTFMSDVGRNVRISSMLARDSVRNRLDPRGPGMSFGEFSYQLLQAYDFWQLHKTNDVTLQIGGSDQYGNITAGIDLITRLQPQHALPSTEIFGLTVPLLLTPSGDKFGKSAGNAIWLDESLTTPYDLYQFFLRTTDTEVERYLKLFTLLPLARIDDIMADGARDPSQRLAHRALAREMILLVHGAEALTRVELMLTILFPNERHENNTTGGTATAAGIVVAFQDARHFYRLARHDVVGVKVAALFKTTGATQSGKTAAQLLRSGGVSVPLAAVPRRLDAESVVGAQDLLDDSVVLFKVGKNRVVVVHLVD